MNTKYALHARFGTPIVALADICEEFFHINKDTAQGKANAGTFPIPVFRMENSKRSPFMVHVDDLANHIDDCHQPALKAWQEKGILALLNSPTQTSFVSTFVDPDKK